MIPFVFWAFPRGQEKVFFSFDMSWLPGFHEVNVSMLGLGIFIAGFFTVAQFSFWGNYLPKAYPIHLRGTGEELRRQHRRPDVRDPFAFLTQQIALFSFIPGETPAAKTAVVAAGVAFTLYLVNLIFSTVLPEQGAEHAEYWFFDRRRRGVVRSSLTTRPDAQPRRLIDHDARTAHRLVSPTDALPLVRLPRGVGLLVLRLPRPTPLHVGPRPAAVTALMPEELIPASSRRRGKTLRRFSSSGGASAASSSALGDKYGTVSQMLTVTVLLLRLHRLHVL